MKDNVTQIWDLTSPKMCRDFLAQVRFGEKGGKITHFDLKDGTRVPLEKATDDQVIEIASMISDAIGSKKHFSVEGVGPKIDLNKYRDFAEEYNDDEPPPKKGA